MLCDNEGAGKGHASRALRDIGVGGMGEVYRANDTVLKRDVALKLLPEPFANDPDRLARFRREAQLLASLNHPNIAAIYGLEDEGDKHFLVMELVPADPLRDMLLRDGAVALDEALQIASQIAEALEHAHEKTVVHRDLKPANVKLTPEGIVKVLDFGLAKAYQEADTDVISSTAPTALSASPTIPGPIIGTPAYMSPEQAKGKTVDKRTDIWALGCLLYELLTGQGAFHRSPCRDHKRAGQPRRTPVNADVAARDPLANARGTDAADPEPDTMQEIIARVLQAEPDWSALPADTPHGVRVLLRRCLQKDAAQRYHAAADVRIQIEETKATPAAAPPPPAIPVPPLWRRALPFAITGVVVAALTAGITLWLRTSMTPAQSAAKPVTLFLPLPPAQQLASTNAEILAFSPDGTLLVYVSVTGGVTQLFLRPLESLEAKAIPGTEDAVGPFFSPDGNWIGFFANGKLKKISVGGGSPVILADALGTSGAWISNESIVFAPQTISGLRKISAAGGEPEVLTTPDPKKEEGRHVWPEILPNGKTVLFTVSVPASQGGNQIVSLSLETGERKVLVQGGAGGRYARSGHLVYARGTTLMAVPFDAERVEVLGPPVPVVEGVRLSAFGLPLYTISNNGTLVYQPGGQEAGTTKLVWVDRKGTQQLLKAPVRNYSRARLSPDGARVATDLQGANRDIWLYDLQRDTLTRLTFEADNSSPVWTPDGKKVVYRSTKGGPANLYWRPSDGTGKEEQLVSSDNTLTPLSFSPDGKFLAYHEITPKTGSDLWVLPLGDDPAASSGQGRKPSLFLQTAFNEASPMFSPDGHWIAYVSDESGVQEIYVRPFPGASGKWQVSTEGGAEPLWSANGRELFYRTGDKMMAVDIVPGPAFTAGNPRLLFRGEYSSGSASGRTTYDVTADGQRFILAMSAQQDTGPTQLNVVQNWFEELKQRVPMQ